MGSSVKRVTVFLVIVMVAAILGVVVYTNRGPDHKKEKTAAAVSQDGAAGDSAQADGGRVGTDTRAFLEDGAFFDSDKEPYSSIARMEGKNLSLLMTSVQKDLRIQVVDNAGGLVAGEPFCVVLNGNEEYTDEDKDGVIYIAHLRAGQYEVALKETDGYRAPETASVIQVKESVEYAVIDDISLLIFTEEDVDPAVEDKEVRSAADDADKSEITGMRESRAGAKVGIDVSKWNKEIDWDRVKAAGAEFAIIRVGYRGASTGKLIEDPYFESNMKGAALAGIPVGVYFFTQALDTVEAVEEASMVASLCRDYKLTYPVFIDTEGAGGSGRADGLDAEARTRVCEAFCETVENAGYQGGVYGARNWLNGMLSMDRLDGYTVWLAEYRDVPLYQGYYHLWQYTSGGSVDGIEGRVDLNISYLKPASEADADRETDVLSGEPGGADKPADAGKPGGAGDGKTDDGIPGDDEPQEIIEPKVIGGASEADF